MRKQQKFKFVNVYTVCERNPKIMISRSPLTSAREKDEIIESVSEDIDKADGVFWYKIKGKWYNTHMLLIEIFKEKYTLDGKFVCVTKCKR